MISDHQQIVRKKAESIQCLPDMNTIINKAVGMWVFLFNIYVILVSDTLAAAIWNSVALTFIIEIDNRFKMNWNRIKLETLLAELLMNYC